MQIEVGQYYRYNSYIKYIIQVIGITEKTLKFKAVGSDYGNHPVGRIGDTGKSWIENSFTLIPGYGTPLYEVVNN